MDEYYNVIGPGYWLYYRWKVFVLGFAVVRLVLVSDIFDSPHFIFRGFRVCPACLEVFTCYMFTHKIKEMHAPFARKAATRGLPIGASACSAQCHRYGRANFIMPLPLPLSLLSSGSYLVLVIVAILAIGDDIVSQQAHVIIWQKYKCNVLHPKASFQPSS